MAKLNPPVTVRRLNLQDDHLLALGRCLALRHGAGFSCGAGSSARW